MIKKSKSKSINSHQYRQNGTQHLITQLGKSIIEVAQKQIVLCKYGVFCSHLRAQGVCSFGHKRSHFHFLNLVPPIDCIEDDEEAKNKLSKIQKKKQKVIDKTINNQIDVAALNKLEHQIKNKGEELVKKEIWENIDHQQKKIIEIINSFDASEIFIKLNQAKTENMDIFEVKKKASMQLKKKNEKLYNQMIDKEYRIANRLIKANLKNKTLSLYQLYLDINHDTIKSVREYFENYFNEDEGIPHEAPENKLQKKQKNYISRLLSQLLHSKPQQYEFSHYFVKIEDSKELQQIKSNIELYNLLIPFSLYKKLSFNKFYFIDCQTDLSYLSISTLLTKDYVKTFHAKFKAFPQYPFGQIQQNQIKFKNWASKIYNKYTESQVQFKIIFLLNCLNLQLSNDNLQDFEAEKLKERTTLLKNIVQIFKPTIIILTKPSNKKICKVLGEILSFESSEIDKSLSLQ